VEFTEPTPLTAAIQIAQDRKLLPTNLSSAQISDWDDEIKRASVFSARTNHAGYVQEIKNTIEDILRGKYNEAEARARLQAELKSLSYDPSRGFPGLEDFNIPPAEPGSLRDLSSDKRTQLIVRTQMRQLANLGYRQQGTTPAALRAFPAWELIRIYPRIVPRGSAKSKSAGWTDRWARAGGKLFDKRMIAAKGDDIWARLGDRDLFDDAIGTDYPPFAFNSGMGWRQVSRAICEQLGVPLDKVKPSKPEPIDNLQISVKGFDPAFLKNLRDELDVEIREGYAKLKQS
jgi:hypothetical protein